jgi:hypothetical protein
VIKPLGVSLYCLHTMICILTQLLMCQRIIKSTLKEECDLPQGNLCRCTLIGMSRDCLSPLKLSKHPLRQISYHAGTVSESSSVKADPLKRTCLTMISIQVHHNATQIQPIQMVSVLIWCTQTSLWYKKPSRVDLDSPDILPRHPCFPFLRSVDTPNLATMTTTYKYTNKT